MALIHELAETAGELLEQLQSGQGRVETISRLEQLIDRVSQPVERSKVPQLLVTLSAEGDLQVESPAEGAVRRQTRLSQGDAGQRMLRMLAEQKKRIDGEATERRKRQISQPNWTLIAKHPQVEIREVQITHCKPGPGLSTSTSKKSLEEMGL